MESRSGRPVTVASKVMTADDTTHQSPGADRRTPLTPRGQGKRQLILDVTAELLARGGYAGTTLAEIAEAAGTQAGSLYYHFASREELALEVLTTGARAALAHSSAAVDRLPSGTSARTRLEAAIMAHVAFMLDRSPAALASIRAIGQIPPTIAEPLSVIFDDYGRFFARLFEAAVAEGAIDATVDIGALRMLVIGAANWSTEWFNADGPSSATDIGHLLCRLVFDGVGTGPGSVSATDG